MTKQQKSEEKITTTKIEEPIIQEKQEDISEKDKSQVKIIERVIENKAISPQDAFGKLNRTQIELIKRTVARNASDDELKLFIQVCKGAQLNPFLKQVHFVKRWDSKEGREVGAIQVGIDGFRSIAESSGQYAGNDDPKFDGEKELEYGQKEKKKIIVPLKATVTVYKLIDGQRFEFTATARWDEYYPGEKIGFQWHMRPYLMLGKCAESLALRKAFPKLLSSMYSQEELDRSSSFESEEVKVQKGFDRLMSLIEKLTITELQDYIKKITDSDKYTKAQKKEYIDVANKQIEKIKKELESEAKNEI